MPWYVAILIEHDKDRGGEGARGRGGVERKER